MQMTELLVLESPDYDYRKQAQLKLKIVTE